MLNWSPDTFWSATYRELHAAMKGRAEMLAATTPGGSGRKLSKREARDLQQWTRDMVKRYPDGPSIKAKGQTVRDG